ncbi:MAG: hypothetical protein QM756_33415 [Polyangiaceae bacterium]
MLLEFDMRTLGTACAGDFLAVGVGTPQLLQFNCSSAGLNLTEQAATNNFPVFYNYSLGPALTAGIWHHFRIYEIGSDLRISIDGSEVFHATMHSVPTADARLLSLAGAAEGVAYDNVVLSCP